MNDIRALLLAIWAMVFANSDVLSEPTLTGLLFCTLSLLTVATLSGWYAAELMDEHKNEEQEERHAPTH